MSISRDLSKFIAPSGQLEYDNTTSGLSATTIKSAIDELNTLLGGGNVGSQATFNVYEFTATASQTTFSLSSNHGQGSDITAGNFVDGVTYIITSVGTTDFVTLYGASSNTVGVTFTANTNPGTGDGTAKVVADYIPGFIKVYLNGVLLSETDYVASDGDNVVLDVGADVGALLSVVVLDSFNTATQLRVLGIDAGAPDNSVTVDASGNLLVGTTTHHNFSGDTTEITVGTLTTGATSGGAVTFGSGSGFLGYLGFQESEGTVGTLTSVPLVFKTGNTEAMRIDSSGNVSIGAPVNNDADAQLHVYGLGQTTANLADSGNMGATLRLSDSSTSAGAGGAIVFANQQGDVANSAGFAAIKGLLSNGSTNTIGDLTFSTRRAITDTSLSEAMRIDSAGNVGIGTNPATKLDINGTLRFTPNTADTNYSADIAAQYDSEHPFTLIVKNNATSFEYMGVYADTGGANNRVVFPTGNVIIGNSTTEATKVTLNKTGFLGSATLGSPTDSMFTIDIRGNLSTDIVETEVLGGYTLDAYDASTATGAGVSKYNGMHFVAGGNFGPSASDVDLVFATGLNGDATEKMRIDSSGSIGQGVTPSAWSTVTALQVKNTHLGGYVDNGYFGANCYYDGSNWRHIANNGASRIELTAGRFEFWNATSAAADAIMAQTQAMTLDASGNLLVGTTSAFTDGSANSGGSGALHIARDNERCLFLKRASSNGAVVEFFRGSITSPVGSISIDASSTAYNTSSDYRLKENVVAMSGATERLKQLKPSRFNFIADPDKTVDGFLAHEVQDVVPEAITGTKDAVDAEGNPEYQGIDQSKLVPLLVATIQELEARIAALEGN